MKACEIAILGLQTKNARAPIAIKGLENDVAVFGMEFAQNSDVTRDGCRRRQVRKVEDEILFWVVPDPEGIVHYQRLPLELVQNMSGRDVAHVERRVLPEPYDVDLCKIDPGFLAERHVIAPLSAHLDLPGTGGDLARLEGKAIRSIDKKVVPSRRRSLGETKSRIRVDIDVLNRVHLKCNAERHSHPL